MERDVEKNQTGINTLYAGPGREQGGGGDYGVAWGYRFNVREWKRGRKGRGGVSGRECEGGSVLLRNGFY